MTPEERIARLEQRADGQDKWLESIDAKVDQILETAALGKGAWLAILKIGGILTAIAAFAAAVATLIEKIRHL